MAESIQDIKSRLLTCPYARQKNPVDRRMQYVANRFNNFVTMVTFAAFGEASGQHGLREQVNRVFFDKLGPYYDQNEQAAKQVMERLAARRATWASPDATRYDPYLPWVARESNRIWRDHYRPYARANRLYAVPEYFDFDTIGFRSPPSPLPRSTVHDPIDRLWRDDLSALYQRSRKLVQGFRAIVDWAEHERVDLNRYTFDEAWEQAEAWGAERGIASGVPQGDVVHAWDDGWTMQELTTAQQLAAEGDIMQHCVESYLSGIGDEHRIFSLRDPAGRPHATVEWDRVDKYVNQLRGKQNMAPKREYLLRVTEWRAAADREGQLLPDGYEVKVSTDGLPDWADATAAEVLGRVTADDWDALAFDNGFVEVADFVSFTRKLEEDVKRTLTRMGRDPDDEIAVHMEMTYILNEVDPVGGAGQSEPPDWTQFGIWQGGLGRALSDYYDEMVEQLIEERVEPKPPYAPAKAR